MDTPQNIDLRIDPEWLIPIEPEGVLTEHAVLVHEGRIVALLPVTEAEKHYRPNEHLKLPGNALIPGLINLHTHAAMALLRGYADDLPLMEWLQKHIWPTEARWMSDSFVRDGSALACLEMLEGGITCFNDMYFYPEATIETAIQAGMRIVSGLIVLDFPTNWAADSDAYIHQGLAIRDRWLNHPRVHFCLAPHAPYSTSDRTLEKVVLYATELDLPIHIHLHETADEIDQSLKQHGIRPLARLEHMGLLGPQLIAVHAVHLTALEIAQFAAQGCHIAHCPSSNLKLASGIAPVTQMTQAGINIGLGTDGTASNNRLDLWEEMRLAALLAKGQSGQAAAVPAMQALRMATLNAAHALGLGHAIGSLIPGKQADMVAVNLSDPTNQPCYHPISQLVYSASRHNVEHVWVAGKPVVVNGQATHLESIRILQQAHLWRNRINHS